MDDMNARRVDLSVIATDCFLSLPGRPPYASASCGRLQCIICRMSGQFMSIPNAMVAMITRSDDSAVVNYCVQCVNIIINNPIHYVIW